MSTFGIRADIAAAMLMAIDTQQISDLVPNDGRRKPRPPAKPSGQPIPEGTYTRQQRRAAERRAVKDLPA